MRKWKQRIISLLLVVAMVFGLAPANVMTVQAATENLAQADGIIWLTKNKAGDSVSEEFEAMVTSMKLDDMVREALDMQGSDKKVYYDGVDVGNVMELIANMDKVNALLDGMKEAITNHELVTFNIGSKEGPKKTIAFRNLTTAKISAGEDNKIYIDHPGAPVDADTLEGMINGALNDTVVSVEHNGVVQSTGFYTPNKTHFEATEFEAEGGASFKSLLRKWPTVTVSPDSNIRKAGEVEVTIYAVEYNQKPAAEKADAKVTQVFEVYMRDQRVKVNAVAMSSDNAPVSDAELDGFKAQYSGNADTYPTEEPELKHYRFLYWEKGLCEGYDYTAVMEAKTDNNGNGLADQLEAAKEYTVEYYVGEKLYASETVKEGALPVGPATDPECPEEGEWELNWVADNASWPAFVYSNITYRAQWTKIETETPVSLEVTGVLLSNGKEVRQTLSLVEYNVDNKEYTVSDPGWESLVSSGYRCTGWYYKVSAGTGEDLNYDGLANEARFYMSGDTNATVLKADDGTVEVFIEFLPVITVNKPVEDGTDTVYGDTEDIVVGGSTDVEIYYYTIETLDGKKYIQCTDGQGVFDPSDYGVVYDENNSDRLYNFKGWEIAGSGNDYNVTPKLEIVDNKINTNINAFNPVIVKDSDKITYTIEGYKSEVSFDYGYGEGDSHTYALDAETEIVVSPFRNEAGEVLFYVKGLKAYVGNSEIASTEDFEISYDAKYKATIKGVYAAIKANSMKRSASVEKLSGVTLVPQYEMLKLKVKDGAKLLAGQEKEFYTEQYVYGQVIGGAYTADVANAISVEYRAQEDSYKVSLNRLFDLLEADGLGALKAQVGDQYDSLEVIPPTGHDKLWLPIESIYSEEVTAQEVADAYLTQKYEEYKADSSIDIFQFVGDVVAELGEVVYGGAHHKFGYVAPGEANPTEELRITYSSEQIGATVAGKVALEDTRTKTTITAKDVTCSYGDDIFAAIMGKVECSADKNLCVTYDAATNVPRDFAGVGVGTYNVKVAFKGDKNYAPAISEAIKLTVNPAKTTVTVEDLITMEGNMYNKDASAKVNNGAPIVQIIAGIAADELAFGVNTDGSVKDWALEFDDETMMLDVWVKLPQTYIELLSNLNIKDFYPESPVEKIEPGKEYLIEDLEKALEDEGLDDQEQLQQLDAILNQIPEIVKDKLGISDLTYGMNVRFDALEAKVYPTNPGFYLNYAATLSALKDKVGVELDKNHTAATDYGFIVISPMVPIPNRGGVQLYDGNVSNAQNVFVYEYNGTATPHDLKVAVNGATLAGEAPFYYGLTTRLDATKAAPSMPGVYFAGYNYTTEMKNEDSGKDELIRLGSDSAIIIIKKQEANLTITGGIFEYEENVDKIAEVKITDKNGNEIQGAATVVSGTVNVKDGTANISANDFYGTINVDFPDALQTKWDAFWNKTGYNNQDVVRPGDLIDFLEISRDEAVKAADTVLDEFEKLAMKDAVSDVLDKVNGKQNKVDVSSDNLVAKAERVREMLNSSVAYYNKLIEQLKPLENLDDNASLTFYDLEKEADKLPYDKTGYYLYLGVITDPELTVDAAKGLVIIHSKDDYVMYDTHVPYDGKPHTIYKEDETKRSDVTVMVNRDTNEISFFLDSDVYSAMNSILAAIPGIEVKVQDGSAAAVSTVYEKAEGYADKVYDKLVELLQDRAIERIEDANATLGGKLDELIIEAKEKLSSLTGRLSDKLQEVDKLPGDTRIILYNMSNPADLKGMPVDVGTYEFYGYDYDVAATRGTLVIEPVYIVVEDEPASKYEGEADPELKANVNFYSYEGTGANVNQVPVTVSNAAELVSYKVERTPGEDVGKYDILIKDLELLDKSGNYVLVERTEDLQDFEILAEIGTIGLGEWRMHLDSVVYMNYYPEVKDFSDKFNFEERAGVVIWTADRRPTRPEVVAENTADTKDIRGWHYNDADQKWYVRTDEIYAKNLGDLVYLRPYVVDKDGDYVYLDGVVYNSPKFFSYDVMSASSVNKKEKDVCGALLQYGANAQLYFGYKTNDLVNVIPSANIKGVAGAYDSVSWNDYELSYDPAYRNNAVDAVTAHVRALAPTLDGNYKTGVSWNKSTLNLAGAVRLSTGFEINESIIDTTQIKKQEVLFWNERDLAVAETLDYSAENYNYKCDLVKATGKEDVTIGTYRAQSDHILAKYLGEAVFYTCRIEMNDGTVYNSGLAYYSPESFAGDHIDTSSGQVVDLCKSIIVYSEMAKKCFLD